ncbi:MAG TPA: MoaD/ThiS family protein [Planctomycetes bacterium]|jgi:molybdopterin converting factor small subunit|nr:MoaD/ThiS family protein [Planctomycetaceae bacterium]HIM27939.1 MoaD/ThiS family protein [Planctomycetota bacterium]
MDPMHVSVKCFALARQLVGAEKIDLELGDDATVLILKQTLAGQYPQMEPLLNSSMIAVDGQYVSDAFRLSPSHEIACIPPVSGG